MATRPVAFVVFSVVPNMLDQSRVWDFSRDFATADVRSRLRDKLVCIRHLSGIAQSVDLITGVSSVGALTIEMVDVGGMITRYVSDPARPLIHDLGSSLPVDPNLGLGRHNRVDVVSDADAEIRIGGDISAYPDLGFIRIDDEDIGYRATYQDGPDGVFRSISRGMRGTLPDVHDAGALVHNGEQIRRNTRVRLELGYDALDESDYGPGPGYALMNVTQIQSTPGGWTITAHDVQVFTRKKIFTKSTTNNPFTIKGNPLRLALRILLSTGNGSNSANDVYEYENGAGVPKDFVDISMFRYFQRQFPLTEMRFREPGPVDAKTFVETQLLRPLGLIPIINQRGQYSVRRVTSPTPLLTGISSATMTYPEIIPPEPPEPPEDSFYILLEDGGRIMLEDLSGAIELEH